MPNGKEERIQKFWLDTIDDGDTQSRFLNKLASDSHQWILRSAHYEMPSEHPKSLDSMRKHLKAIKLGLKNSPYLEAQINDVFSHVLETQFEDCLHGELLADEYYFAIRERILSLLAHQN